MVIRELINYIKISLLLDIAYQHIYLINTKIARFPLEQNVGQFLGHFGSKNRAIFGIKCRVIFGSLCSRKFCDP